MRRGWYVAGAILLLVDVMALTWWIRRREPPTSTPLFVVEPTAAVPVRNALAFGAWPTPRTNLLADVQVGLFQPTASGQLESALYGSVRTGSSGGRIHPSFHEGIDIAPLARDRSGRARDPVFAVADGRVVHANRHAGNSNYGVYVVLMHEDALGEVYTLYAHLADIDRAIRPGHPVGAGTVLGRMGNTPSHIVPVSRSHLHFETGVMLNSAFERWWAVRHKKNRNSHGRFHGWNLQGCDPLRLFADREHRGHIFSLLTHLLELPVAFEILMPATHLPDYYCRYPALWTGGPFNGPAFVMAVSEGGIPLRGRPATADEITRLGGPGKTPVVLSADPSVLGNNGKRLVARRGEGWALGSQGSQWLDILMWVAE